MSEDLSQELAEYESDPHDVGPPRGTPVPQREAYIPEWAPDFSQRLALPVLEHDGSEIKMADGELVRLRNILPERRWAVDPETDRLLSQDNFERLYRQYILFTCSRSGRIVPMARQNRYFEPDKEPVPNVRDWALRAPDGRGLTWPAAGTFKPQKLYSSDGTNPVDVESIRAAAQNEGARLNVADQLQALTERLNTGDIDEAEYNKSVQAIAQGAPTKAEVTAPTADPGTTEAASAGFADAGASNAASEAAAIRSANESKALGAPPRRRAKKAAPEAKAD